MQQYSLSMRNHSGIRSGFTLLRRVSSSICGRLAKIFLMRINCNLDGNLATLNLLADCRRRTIRRFYRRKVGQRLLLFFFIPDINKAEPLGPTGTPAARDNPSSNDIDVSIGEYLCYRKE